MTIPFTCPHCGHFTETLPQFAGRSGPCAGCGQKITILQQSEPPSTPETRAVHRRSWLSLAVVAGAIVVSLVLLSLIIWQGLGRSAAVVVPSAAMTCEQNLARIGQALLAYHDRHGNFPAPVTLGKAGTSGLSWRAEILPQLNEKKMMDHVDFNDDWDGSINANVAPGRPKVYAAADDEQLNDVETSYVGIVGDEFAFSTNETRSKQDFRDGLESTIVVIEVRGLGISWLEPQDLTADKFEWLINNRVTGVGSRHANGGVHVLMANGDVHWLDESVPPEVLRALATIDGGESVDLQRWLKR